MNPNEDKNHVAYVRGDKAFRAGRFSDAISWFKEAVAEWPEDYQAHFALGNSYFEAGKYVKAEQSYRQALLLAPEKERPDIQFNLGNTLFEEGKFTEALGMYETVASGSPVYPSALRNVALTRAAVAAQQHFSVKPAVRKAARASQLRRLGAGLMPH